MLVAHQDTASRFVQRKKRMHYTDPHFQHDSCDISNALTRDMSETMAFLESCTDEEICLMSYLT